MVLSDPAVAVGKDQEMKPERQGPGNRGTRSSPSADEGSDV